MVRIFRWGSLLVLAAALVAAGLTYPQLRARILVPVVATATATTMSIVLPMPTATSTPAETRVPEVRATAPAVVIMPPVTTTQVADDAPVIATPVAYATTSLVPDVQVLGPAIVANPGGGVAPSDTPVAAKTTPLPPTARPTTSLRTSTPTVAAVMTLTATSQAIAGGVTTPITATPALIATRDPSTLVQIPTRDPSTLDVPTAPPVTGPYVLGDAPLFAGPGTTFPVAGEVISGEVLDILGWYTEGTWYLLTNGLWLEAIHVGNAPATLPLVIPTATFTPSPTPTITPTPTPTFTPVGPETPTPTPTSLDQEICSCTSDQYDCLGSVFPNRAAAQLCLEYCFRQTGLDLHNLDPNDNGVACENLP